MTSIEHNIDNANITHNILTNIMANIIINIFVIWASDEIRCIEGCALFEFQYTNQYINRYND